MTAENHRFSFVRASANKKTGPIPVTMTSANSCPTACPLATDKEGGCYAASGPVAIHWHRLAKHTDDKPQGISFADMLAQVQRLPHGQLFRHNVAGDLPTVDREHIDAEALRQIVQAAEGKRGFTYTHHNPNTGDNAELIRKANQRGFTVNLSANNLEHADMLAALNVGPVVTLLDDAPAGNLTQTPKGRPVVVCPAVSAEDMDCTRCQLCAKVDRRSIVGFPVHGTGKRKAAKVFMMKAAA